MCSDEKQVLTREAEWLAQPGRLDGGCLVSMNHSVGLAVFPNISKHLASQNWSHKETGKAKDLGTMHIPVPVQRCELPAQCSSSLLNSLEQLGSAVSEAETHGGYLKWLFYHCLRAAVKLVMVDQGQLLPSAATAPCFNLRAHILSLKPYYQENFEFNESIFFSNLLQVAELNHGSGEPPRGLFRTSKYRQPLHPHLHAHMCTQARAHTHTHTCIHYLWLSFHLCWHGWEFTTALKKLQAVPQKFHILLSCYYGTLVRQPNAMSAP